MAEIGLFLSSEEHGARTLVEHARRGQDAGFDALFISDHFHPWVDRQGESPFVWGVIGAIAATTSLRVTTGVTCPTGRIHPVVLAQATATAQSLLNGRFVFGVGSGEALNEHVTGAPWPPPEIRLDMLEEAIELIRRLWTGEWVRHHGTHFDVPGARLYSLPETPPPIRISAFGPRAMRLAARLGDGLVTTQPDNAAVRAYRDAGGRGPVVGALKVCYGTDEEAARRLAYELWPTEALPGQSNQELAMPAHFEQLAKLVTEDMVAESVVCGADPERHAASIRRFIDAGFDEVYVSQIGPDLPGFLEFFAKEVRPRIEP